MKFTNLKTGASVEVNVTFPEPVLSDTFQSYPVTSSNLESVRYAKSAKLLRVTFHSGEEYEYEGVDYESFYDLLHARSVGKHFNQYIKDAFECKHLEEV